MILFKVNEQPDRQRPLGVQDQSNWKVDRSVMWQAYHVSFFIFIFILWKVRFNALFLYTLVLDIPENLKVMFYWLCALPLVLIKSSNLPFFACPTYLIIFRLLKNPGQMEYLSRIWDVNLDMASWRQELSVGTSWEESWSLQVRNKVFKNTLLFWLTLSITLHKTNLLTTSY